MRELCAIFFKMGFTDYLQIIARGKDSDFC